MSYHNKIYSITNNVLQSILDCENFDPLDIDKYSSLYGEIIDDSFFCTDLRLIKKEWEEKNIFYLSRDNLLKIIECYISFIDEGFNKILNDEKNKTSLLEGVLHSVVSSIVCSKAVEAVNRYQSRISKGRAFKGDNLINGYYNLVALVSTFDFDNKTLFLERS